MNFYWTQRCFIQQYILKKPFIYIYLVSTIFFKKIRRNDKLPADWRCLWQKMALMRPLTQITHETRYSAI
ncbi:unnamed protein product [Nezara viridula]|uniref:Uncharacterized protein n=1 Tax=Nezara viridula TaxID=85310 RepID=A0A9P0HSQ9_NEZVI|nr:unnamed protein product [Nezara viridula]